MRVLVLGAGVAGASVAWSLARRGAEVVVVDRLHDGAATLAGAGSVRASLGITEPGFVEAYAAAVRYYPEAVRGLGEVLGGNVSDVVGYRVVGGLWLSRDDDALADVGRPRRGPRVAGSPGRRASAAARAPRRGPDARRRRARRRRPPLPDGTAVILGSDGRIEAGFLGGS
ncbi:hypothetical protein GCM10025864_13400 [Luteimicrobium album]|uniref:FAD dependent oxidoreductase domain-containing protein n=1 Tax=Luteimicrobium album TaxID=1054550 RepID=A0ABQ6I008_9MICO|nr:FAD-dependent oxidoreductase [Luteimicrobium album]GMA23581.1 hypothetical protein GCM10025864_13400 [Luteimicrobium album]